MATYTTPEGDSLDLEPDDVARLRAMHLLTGRPVFELAADAVQLLQHSLVPTSKPKTAKSGRKPKTS